MGIVSPRVIGEPSWIWLNGSDGSVDGRRERVIGSRPVGSITYDCEPHSNGCFLTHLTRQSEGQRNAVQFDHVTFLFSQKVQRRASRYSEKHW